MPIVVNQITVKRLLGRRPQPQVPVQVRRRRLRLFEPDRFSSLKMYAPGHVDVADNTVMKRANCLLNCLARAPLRSPLNNPVVLPGGFHHHAAFDQIMSDRLLDIDVLSRLAGPDGCERMPMIAGSDGNGIDGPVIKDTAQIRLQGRLLPRLFCELTSLFRHPLLVGIAEGCNFYAFDARQRTHVVATAAAKTDYGHTHTIIDAAGGAPHECNWYSRCAGTLQEVTACHLGHRHHPPFMIFSE